MNAGSTFARALSQHPREFSDIYCAVIGAGEHSGNLGLVLERLADDLEERQALKAKLVGAALYPAIVTVVAIVIVLFLVGYVVPSVTAWAAAGLATLMLLGVATRIKVRDSLMETLPAAVLMLLNGFVAWYALSVSG